jgi:hypothetical protein
MQFQVAMYNLGFVELVFTAYFVNGLKEDIKFVVQTHLPDYVDKAALLAKIQHQAVERAKSKSAKWASAKATSSNQDTQ